MGYTVVYKKKNKILNASPPNRRQAVEVAVYNKPLVFAANTSVSKKKRMSNDITNVLSNGQWKGKRCFIIGGGPSLVNINAEKLENELTIGINKSFTRFNTNICYAMDTGFYDDITYKGEGEKERLEINKQWKRYQGIKVFLQPTGDKKGKFKLDDNVYVVKRIYEKKVSFDLAEGICGLSNSGIGAIMLACCLGANPIFLCGFDMKVDRKMNKTHWHTGYSKQEISGFARSLENYKQMFYEFAPVWRQLGIQIINVNTEEGTAMRCFPIKSFAEVI